MRLSTVLEDMPGAEIIRDAEITGIAYDSRAVSPGYAFFAIPGLKDDGRRYIPQALSRGASAVVTNLGGDFPVTGGLGVPEEAGLAVVRDPRRALSSAAAVYYGYPSRSLTAVGITGTKGKTTTCHLVRSVLEACGLKTGLIGTVHNIVGDEERPVTRTTPESLELQSLLSEMVAKGCDAVAMEVSSHALELFRVEDILFDAAVFTNMGWDHLDFHDTMEAYAGAKARLFGLLEKSRGLKKKELPLVAAINGDDAYAPLFREKATGRVVTYGLGETHEVRAEDIRMDPRGTTFTLVCGETRRTVRTVLVGRFNVYNSLAAAAVAYGFGFDLEDIARGLETAKSVRGRVELVPGDRFSVWVDYAHTPESLRDILALAREMSTGKVIAVFGCGGDRDAGRRPVMGKLAGDMADFVIITNDNPRTEDPDKILDDIESGLKESSGGSSYLRIKDRRAAINEAIGRAGPGDVVVLAGKGHETYQIIGREVHHFDDAEEARKAISAVSGKEGERR
ncbi:MAG TPA: UDP-N-acetylmuramoyl-L-alanyl-D-glutamate--2,6-diaminopimelate ligase [Firmicutes bacterium]|nr:UDP-N-acetylmuramoyl-L-alanyl-D-glutamate--2,6-diaminopimelate ligase [Candidatus Fermentithermobacillaceae bacterium]